MSIPNIQLNNGVQMPVLGLGVYQLGKGEETKQAVRWAFEAGYRHIDTASYYRNEQQVGEAIRESGIPREKIFVTTKLWPTDFLRPDAAFEASRRKLGLAYIDLYLIHWPSIGRDRAWKILENIYASGRVKAIGVSNYSIKHLESLKSIATVMPAVNQVEFSPFRFEKELLEYSVAHGIQLEAYSPLTRGKRLDDTTIADIARTYGKTPAQIMIRWSLQHGLVVIPKSSKKERIEENAAVFDVEITAKDMQRLDQLDEHYSSLFG